MTLPLAPLYVASIEVSPWRRTIERVTSLVRERAKRDALVVDLMCGPGQMIAKLAFEREDLGIVGVDVNSGYCEFGVEISPGARFIVSDVIEYLTSKPFELASADIVTVTAGLHHLDICKQRELIELLRDQLSPESTLIVGEICIEGGGNGRRELQREVMRYYWGVLEYVLDATQEIELIAEAIDVLRADLVGEEYKVSLAELVEILDVGFTDVQVERVWPKGDEYEMGVRTGEFVVVCRNPRQGEKTGSAARDR